MKSMVWSLRQVAAALALGLIQQTVAWAAEPDLLASWRARWEANMARNERAAYCETETGEQLGWLTSTYLKANWNGYRLTLNRDYLDRLATCAAKVLKRGVREPDGFVGWPKEDGAASIANQGYFTDNMLGEAMLFQPLVLAAQVIQNDDGLRAAYGKQAAEWLAMSEQIFAKWEARGTWRTLANGGVWIVPDFGLDEARTGWTEGYLDRQHNGFTMPVNKQNAIAIWCLAMFEATAKATYRDHAIAWWQVMKSRMRLDTFRQTYVWNYWEPAGPWDYPAQQPVGARGRAAKHWIGVHPNGGYYAIDVDSIVAAFEQGPVFSRRDIDGLIRTNLSMWNGVDAPAKFKSIDGHSFDDRWKDTPGVLWEALAPYDGRLRAIFEHNYDANSWASLWITPWWLAEVAKQKGSKPTGLPAL